MNRKEFLELFGKHCRILKKASVEQFNKMETILKNNVELDHKNSEYDVNRIDKIYCPFDDDIIGVNYRLDELWEGETYDDATSYFAPFYFEEKSDEALKTIAKQMYKVYLKVKKEIN